ncbi:hypothetical protein RK21_02178 [Pseudomonas plecoglossicida]|nr:hypothetical protein RK21_02178 [Pseudomonas plecoglossicida]
MGAGLPANTGAAGANHRVACRGLLCSPSRHKAAPAIDGAR